MNSSERPLCWLCAEAATKDGAEIERLRALVGEMREALASICDPGLRPCAENFENARARAAKVLRTGDAALGPTDAPPS